MKKFKISKWLVAIAMVISASVALGAVAIDTGVWADNNSSEQRDTGMIVSPMTTRIVLIPGETYNGTVTVSNSAAAKQNLKYSVSVGSFTQQQNEDNTKGQVNVQEVTEYNEMMKWITLGRESGEVAPNESQTVSYSIDVPENAPAGGQYATIIFQNDTKPEETGGAVSIENQVQIASIIYAEVAGETRNEGEILENNIPGFLTTGKLEATSLVENRGNVHTDAKYTLQVWPMFSDEEVCTNEEDPGTSLVMPGTKQYHVESCDLGPVGLYKAKQTVTIFGETSVLDATIIVCPIWLIVVILIVIAVIIFLIVRMVQKRKK